VAGASSPANSACAAFFRDHVVPAAEDQHSDRPVLAAVKAVTPAFRQFAAFEFCSSRASVDWSAAVYFEICLRTGAGQQAMLCCGSPHCQSLVASGCTGRWRQMQSICKQPCKWSSAVFRWSTSAAPPWLFLVNRSCSFSCFVVSCNRKMTLLIPSVAQLWSLSWQLLWFATVRTSCSLRQGFFVNLLLMHRCRFTTAVNLTSSFQSVFMIYAGHCFLYWESKSGVGCSVHYMGRRCGRTCSQAYRSR